MVLGVCGIAVSIVPIVALGQGHLLGLAGLGLALMLFVALVPRLGLRPWPATILALILIAATGAGLTRFAVPTDLLRLADSSTDESFAVAQRALSGSQWVGSGVGSFPEISRVYSDFGTSGPVMPPSTAVAIAIEWGRPAVPVLAAIALQLCLFTLRGAVGRGRDSFFASLATAGVLCALCASFVDPADARCPNHSRGHDQTWHLAMRWTNQQFVTRSDQRQTRSLEMVAQSLESGICIRTQ
jgi:hypothetical protein